MLLDQTGSKSARERLAAVHTRAGRLVACDLEGMAAEELAGNTALPYDPQQPVDVDDLVFHLAGERCALGEPRMEPRVRNRLALDAADRPAPCRVRVEPRQHRPNTRGLG